MLCCILPLLLNIMPKNVSAGLSFHFLGLVLYYCQDHFLQHLSPVSFCPSLQVFTTPLWPAHATSEKPQTQNTSLVTCRSSTSPLSNCHLGMHMSCLACSAPRSAHLPESHPKRPSPYGLSPPLPWGQWTIVVFAISILISISMESG